MKRIAFLVFLGILAMFAACSTDGVGGQQKENQPPTVWLSAGPPEGSTGKYRVQMYWGGWDPDGEIKGYEYLVTDNKTGMFNPADTVGVDWSPVSGNDSTFTFSADEKADSLKLLIWTFTRSHTFFIRAIDEQGLRSKRPAYRSFTSRTISPEVIIDVPVRNFNNPALVPPITTFKWHARDYVDDLLIIQDPDSVQWALVSTLEHGGLNQYQKTINYMRTPAAEKEWGPFVWYKAPQDSGKFWTTPVINTGTYIFAIRAKDEAGAITPTLDEDFNWRRVKVSALKNGPLMTVTNEYIGVLRTAACNTPATFLDSPAGVPLEFKIRADASSYGGTVVGYRYGWDITDLSNPEKWEVDVTPFVGSIATVPARTYFFGTHTLTMEVVDNSGYCSRIEVKVNIVPFTLERNLLVVDDDKSDDASLGWDSTNGSVPSDAEQDQFWIDMVSDVDGFDPDLDMVDTKLGPLPLATLAQYKSIIWSNRSDVAQRPPYPVLYAYIAHRPKNPPESVVSSGGKVYPNVLALSMAAGGHVMIAGTHPIQNVVNRQYTGAAGVRYPLIFLYELEGTQTTAPSGDALSNPVGDLSFGYRDLCLEVLDYCNVNFIGRTNKMYCRTDLVRPHGTTATTDRDDTLREGRPLDLNFPPLTLRAEVAGPGRWYSPDQRGLNCEVYNPEYFRKGQRCSYVPAETRPCFQPIYGLGCNDTLEKTYNQPVAFWTSVYADRIADVPGAVAARSVVFGFQPVYTDPTEFKLAMNYILFNEWKLPKSVSASLTTGTRSGASPE